MKYLRGNCVECGGKLEFPRGGLGQTIQCPHCNESTILRAEETRRTLSGSFSRRLLLFASVVLLGLGLISWFVVLKPRSEAKIARRTFIQTFRNDLVSLEVAIEKGIAQYEFTQRSRQLVAQARAHSRMWTAEEKTTLNHLEFYFDGLSHFWPKYIQNQCCMRAEPEDRVWLTKLGLSNDTNIWGAYDFQAASDAFNSSERGRTEAAIGMTELYRLGPGLGGRAASQARGASLDRQIEFSKQQLANFYRIKAEAARLKQNFDPGFVMDRLIRSTGEEISSLMKLLQKESGFP